MLAGRKGGVSQDTLHGAGSVGVATEKGWLVRSCSRWGRSRTRTQKVKPLTLGLRKWFEPGEIFAPVLPN